MRREVSLDRFAKKGMGRMSRFGRVLAVVLVAAAAAMLSGTGVASADEAPNTQTRMRDYSDGEVWATRWTWARD